MALDATVLDLKNMIAEQASIPAERQRIIYSGRVLKDPDTISIYKIKSGQTVHLIRGAAPQSAPPTSAPASATAAATATPSPATSRSSVPTSLATGGTAGNPLADLTGARYAGIANLPSASMFGPDGGMGAMPNPEDFANMLSQPGVREQMDAMLSNPQMVEMLINSTPQLQGMAPMFRSMMNNPTFRSMLTNPESIRSMMQMRQAMNPAGTSSFPAPGAADDTPETPATAAPAAGAAAGAAGAAAPGAAPDLSSLLAGLQGAGGAGGAGMGNLDALAASLGAFGVPPPGGANAAGAGANPFAAMMTPEALQQQTQYLQSFNQALEASRASANAADNADTRPPEEKYESQLRQLNELGFYDFDRNVSALRRSGGNVQGAIEALLDNLV